MTWGLVASAAATVVGGVMSSSASKKAAKSQSAAAQKGIDAEERMFDKSLELQQPYREAGYGALGELQGLADPTGRANALDDYYGSREYQSMQQQQEGQVMRNAQMTGGVRSGGNQVALASIAPQLGQNYLSNQYNQYTGIANLGMGAASQGAGQAMQLGGSMNATQQQMGLARAQNQLAQGNIQSNTVGTLGGLFGDYTKRGQ